MCPNRLCHPPTHDPGHLVYGPPEPGKLFPVLHEDGGEGVDDAVAIDGVVGAEGQSDRNKK